MKKFLISILILFIILSCKKTEPVEEENPLLHTQFVLEYNFSYGTHPQQNMDIFIPRGNRDTMALVVLVHGGSWVSGDKSHFSQWFNWKKNEKRFAIININYRLDTDMTRPLPMQTDDIHAAIESLRNQFHFPAKRIALIGASAGGHLVSQYAYKYDRGAYVKAVINFVGPVDFNDPEYHVPGGHWEWIFTGIEHIFNLPYDGNEYRYAEWSPYHHVSGQSAPSILFYAGQDTIVPYTQGVRLHEKLNRFSVDNEYYFYPQSGHLFNSDDMQDALHKVDDFLERHL